MRRTTAAVVTAGLALGSVPTASAQSTPVDLSNLTLAELVQVDVIPDDEEAAADRWQVDYSVVRVVFDGYRDGTVDIALSDLLGPPRGGTFPVLPTRIVQQAHIVQLSYALPRRTSVSLAVPYIHQSTDHISVVAGYDAFNITSDGIGDLSVTFSHRPLSTGRHSVTWTAGASLPSGSIDEEGDTPRNTGQPVEQLPYTMQLGSGTYDAILAVTYRGNLDPVVGLGPIGHGVRISGKIRTGTNARDYRLGDLLLASLWASARPSRWVEPELELRGQFWDAISGADTALQLGPGVFPAPVTNPALFGGKKLNLRVGATLHLPESLGRQTIGVGGSWPVYQSLNGPQPQETWRLDADWQVSF